MTAAVVTEAIERRFGQKVAVAGVDLEVAEGEIYGFLGPNGAGKTTLVRMLCTLLLPTAGRARVAGADVADEPDEVRLRIGVALQDAALDDRQNGVELLRLQARLYGLSRADTARRIEELRGLIDIGDALDQRIGTYSGGMKRRLDLAAALVHDRRAVPRRAHHRPRSGEPGRGLERGASPEPGSRDDDLPHDAVPRGGRRARGSGRHSSTVVGSSRTGRPTS